MALTEPDPVVGPRSSHVPTDGDYNLDGPPESQRTFPSRDNCGDVRSKTTAPNKPNTVPLPAPSSITKDGHQVLSDAPRAPFGTVDRPEIVYDDRVVEELNDEGERRFPRSAMPPMMARIARG